MSTQKITDGTVQIDTSLVTPPAATTLNGAINNAVTAIVVTSGAGVVNGTYITILAETTNTTESVLVTAGGGTANLTVTRAQLGTAASAHSNAAAVNLPGALVFQLLTIAQAPNRELFIRKTSSDIGYVDVTAGSGNTFAGGGGHIFLPDNGSNGTLHLKFPGSGAVLIVLASGGGGGGVGAPGQGYTWRGAYNGATAYVPYDTVSYLGATYVCILASTGNLPTNTTYFSLLAAAGAPGGSATPPGVFTIGAVTAEWVVIRAS